MSTTAKIAGGVITGGFSTVVVQRYTDSSEFLKDPQKAEIREEQKKKLDFEIQQQSEELEKKKRELEVLAENIAKQRAALNEERSAVQQMQQTATTQVAVSESAVIGTVQQVAQAGEPADVQPEKPKADVVPTDNVPKRPAVFDGGGHKEKPVATTNDARKDAVAFVSSGDVVTIEKGDTDIETERLRMEIKRLERELSAERSAQDFALMRQKAVLEEREQCLAEREQALRERRYTDKATQTDDDLYEAAFGGNDPFDKPGSKKVKTPALKRRYSFNKASPVATMGPNPKSSFSMPSRSALALMETGKKTKTSTPKESDVFSKMSKEEIRDYARKEMEHATDAIDSKTLEKINGESWETKEEQQSMVSKFKNKINSVLGSQPKEISDYSIDQVLEGHPKRSQYEKHIKVLQENVPITRGIRTVSTLNAMAAAIRSNLKPKPVPPETYVKLLIKSADEVAKYLKNLPKGTKDEIERRKKRLEEVLERRNTLRKNVDEILKQESAPVTVVEGLKKLNDAKANAENLVKALYKDDDSGLLKGFEEVQNDWKRVTMSSKTLYPTNALPPPPFLPVADITSKDDGLPEMGWADTLRAADESFKKQDDKNTEAYDDALKPYFEIVKKDTENNKQLNKITEEISKQRLELSKVQKDTDEAVKLTHDLNESLRKQKELLKIKNNLRKEKDKVIHDVVTPVAQTWKTYRQAAYNDPKKKLLVDQQRWLDTGLSNQTKIDSNVLKAKEELRKDSERLSASEVKRLEILGVKSDDNGGVALTEQEKKDRKQFITDVKQCEKLSEALRDKYKVAVRQKESLEKIDIQDMSADRYHVTLQELSVFGSQEVYGCFMALAPSIEELTIERFDNESADTPFLNFAKLCRRLTALKKLSVKGIFGTNVDAAKCGTKTFFDALRENKLPDEFQTARLGLDGEDRFFDVIALIPGLETFEMYSTDRDENPNDTDGGLTSVERIYAAVEPCREVRLPNMNTKAQFFDCLTYSETVVKKHLRLCTNSFGGMMRTEGFPEVLYRLLESGKATVEWFGNLGIGNIQPYTKADNTDGRLAIPDNNSDTIDKITQTLNDQETDGKHLENWASDAHFSENFLKNPEVYLKLSGTHSEVFKSMLTEYNEKELNPLYIACKRLEALKKVQTKVAFENVVAKDPLSDVLKKYPVLKDDGVAFDGIRTATDGSTLRKTILPALLNLVLRERINGKSYIVLAVEDGVQEMEEYTDEKTGKTMRRKVEGKFSNTGWWYFPSPANSLWAKEAFAVSTGDEAFMNLRKEEKEDLKMKMLDASIDFSNFIDAGFDYEIASCQLDPRVGRECLSKIDQTILYWNYFSRMMKTGNLRVATDAPADRRTLFEIFSEVANAQSAHEKLYEAFEKMCVENEKLNPMKSTMNKLREKIATLQAPDEEEQRKEEEGKLSKKEEEVKKVTEELKKHRATMDAYASSLTKTRDFLEEKLPYLKKVAKELNDADKKGKLETATQPNLPNNNKTGGVPKGTDPKPLPKQKIMNPLGFKNSQADVSLWVTKGRKVKYRLAGTKTLLNDLGSQLSVIMPTAGLMLSKGKVPDEKSVEKAVNANALKIEKDKGEYYVVLTVQ